MRVLLVIGWLSVMALAPLHAESIRADSDCSLASPVMVAAKAQARLQQVQAVDEMQETVAAEVRADIHALKDALATVTDARMACLHADATADAAAIQNEFAGAMKANQPAGTVPSPDAPTYGGALTVGMQRTTTTPALLLVQWGFGIECGDDNLLLAYVYRDGAWRQAMRWQSGDYGQISGAFGNGFSYLALPAPVPQLVVFHGTPWCTSRWSGFGLDVLTPGKDAVAPRVLFHQDHGYVLGDFEPVMKIRPDGFELRAEVGMRDMDVMTRTGIFRYRVNGEQVSRVQPVAMNGRDFVDEWLQVGWPEASAWSDPQTLPALEQAHGQLLSGLNAKDHPMSASYGPVRSCSDDRNKYQVQLDLQPSGKPGRTVSHYFLIRSGTNSFTMLSALSAPDAQCKGPDLMKKRS